VEEFIRGRPSVQTAIKKFIQTIDSFKVNAKTRPDIEAQKPAAGELR